MGGPDQERRGEERRSTRHQALGRRLDRHPASGDRGLGVLGRDPAAGGRIAGVERRGVGEQRLEAAEAGRVGNLRLDGHVERRVRRNVERR